MRLDNQFNLGPLSRYNVRIKVKKNEGTRRRSALPIGPRDETDAERLERKRNFRRRKNVKLHKIGSRCKFSLLPLDFIRQEAKLDQSFSALLPTCEIKSAKKDDSSSSHDYYTDYSDSKQSFKSSSSKLDTKLHVDYENYYANYKYSLETASNTYEY